MHRFGSALTRLIASFLPGGSPDEALSARAFVDWPRARLIIDRLFWWEPSHCRAAAQRHYDRALLSVSRYGPLLDAPAEVHGPDGG